MAARIHVKSTILAAVAIIAVAFVLGAGPLDPPPGPVSSTMKTLDEVEPRIPINQTNTPGDDDSIYRIAAPGSYYLTENLEGETGKHGIEIAADSVSIDLRGFNLDGGFGSKSAIITTAQFATLRIHNGNIKAWGEDAINLGTSLTPTIADINITGYAIMTTGIRVDHGAIISRCNIALTNGPAIVGGNSCVITDCIARQSVSDNGFVLGADAIVRNCTAFDNAQSGFVLSNSATVVGCTAASNQLNGFEAGTDSNFDTCTARNNCLGTGTSLAGISTGYGSTIRGCTVADNRSDGIDSPMATISDCTAKANFGDGIGAGVGTITNCVATGNGGVGISATSSATIRGCSANSNDDGGISAGNTAMVAHCTVNFNGDFGVFVGFGSRVLHNTVRGSPVGIWAHSGSSRIEGNSVSSNQTGFVVTQSGSLIIANSSRGDDLAYDIAAQNRYGPILNLTSTATPAVSGNAAASTLGTTDPHANLAQ